MEDKYSLEDLEVFNKMLNLQMSDKRKEELLPIFNDWISRAESVDKKMSMKPYVDIIPSNIFTH